MSPTTAPQAPRRAAPSKYVPSVLICVPRVVFDQYWPLPWADILAAAEQGRDGLTIVHELPPVFVAGFWSQTPNPAAQCDVAYLREGTQWGEAGRTLLWQQNW